MKSEWTWKRCAMTVLCAAAYFAAYRLIMWIVGSLGALIANGMLDQGWLERSQGMMINHVVTLAIYASGVAALWIWMRSRHRRVRDEVGVRPLEVIPMTVSLIGGVSANIVVSWLFECIPFPESWMTQYEESAAPVFYDYSWMTAVITIVAAPIIEELLFRGLIYTRLRRGMPRTLAAAISALMFGVVHGNFLWGMYAFAIGMLFVWMFEMTGSLKANILCHIGFNAAGQFSLQQVLPQPTRTIVYVLGSVMLCLVAVTLWMQRKVKAEAEK